MYKLLVLVILSLQFTCNKQTKAVDEKVGIDLLEDKSLSLFDKKGGSAEYFLKDGILTGVAENDIPNTFLTTKEQYEDFALSFSVKVDERLNSGVQIRSLPFMDDNAYEMLRGYQVEIDPSERAWSGGIYEERGRGWIGNLAANPEGRAAFKNGQWNDYFIEVKGNHIRVWINGVCTVNLIDDIGKKGHIGFQVHAIYDESHAGATVQWKDIMLYPDSVDQRELTDKEKALEINLLPNQLSEYEKEMGWKIVNLRNDIKPAQEMRSWYLGDKSICADGVGMAPLDIPRTSKNFEIKFEYTLGESGQAMFMYAKDERENDNMSFYMADTSSLKSDSLKYQSAGSLYRMMGAKNLSNPDRDLTLRSHDQWSQAHIIFSKDRLQHWLNHNLVIDMDADQFVEANPKSIWRFLNIESTVCIRSIKYRSLD